MSASRSLPARQRGAVTIFLSLLMLLLITVLVTTAFTMSTTGLRSVGNMQARNEAIAAAQLVIETELGGPFYTTPAALSGQTVDINNDGTTDLFGTARHDHNNSDNDDYRRNCAGCADVSERYIG